MNNDVSWEVAAQTALDIHRRVITAMRERVTTGTRREIRPRTAISRSHSDARVRPGSAPPGRAKGHSPCTNNNHITVLVPSLENTSTVNMTSKAEQQAWETLRHTSDDQQRPRLSRSTETFGQARPKGVPAEYHLNPAARAQQQQGISRRSTSFTSWGRGTSGYRTTAVDSCIGASIRRRNGTLGRHYDAGTALAEPDAGSRRRPSGVGATFLFGRFLREHARKARKEEKYFVRTLWAEARANEDRQIEMMDKASQWSRDLGKDVLYLPHRVGGKLHVLKIDNGIEAAKLDDEGTGGGGGLRNLEGYGTVVSIESFVKGDNARLEKAFYAKRGRVCPNRDGAATRGPKFKEPSKSRGSSSRKQVRDYPDAAGTCRELHKLIRDAVGLVKALTAQAEELERQGGIARRGGVGSLSKEEQAEIRK